MSGAAISATIGSAEDGWPEKTNPGPRPEWVLIENGMARHWAGVAGVPLVVTSRYGGASFDGYVMSLCGHRLTKPRVLHPRHGVTCPTCKARRRWPVMEDGKLFEECFAQVVVNSTEDRMSRTQIYQFNEDVSVVTDAADERDFIDTFADALSELENGVNRKAIAAGFDIVAKIRGYKSNVHERRMLASGRWPHPSEVPVGEAGDTVDEE